MRPGQRMVHIGRRPDMPTHLSGSKKNKRTEVTGRHDNSNTFLSSVSLSLFHLRRYLFTPGYHFRRHLATDRDV